MQVICEKAEKSDIPTIDKKKYLVPAVSQLPSTLVIELNARTLLLVNSSMSSGWSLCIEAMSYVPANAVQEANQACT